MESRALESQMYGDPMEVYAAKQAREQRRAAEQAQRPAKRPILTLKRESKAEKVERWSAAREAAESLFDVPIPPRPALES